MYSMKENTKFNFMIYTSFLYLYIRCNFFFYIYKSYAIFFSPFIFIIFVLSSLFYDSMAFPHNFFERIFASYFYCCRTYDVKLFITLWVLQAYEKAYIIILVLNPQLTLLNCICIFLSTCSLFITI